MSKNQGSESSQAKPVKADKASSSADKGDRASKNRQQSQGGEGGISARIQAFKEYLVLSRAELRKVSWPTWKETRATTLVVLGFVVVMAILLGLVDLVLSSAVRFILS